MRALPGQLMIMAIRVVHLEVVQPLLSLIATFVKAGDKDYTLNEMMSAARA